MNPYVYPTKCHACGEPGSTTPRGSIAEWEGATILCENRVRCAERVQENMKKLEEKIAQLEKSAA